MIIYPQIPSFRVTASHLSLVEKSKLLMQVPSVLGQEQQDFQMVNQHMCFRCISMDGMKPALETFLFPNPS